MLPPTHLPLLALLAASGVRAICQLDTMAVFEVHLETFWHRKDFPKHYPEWRPPASWSKMIGFSHDSSYEIFRRGEAASQALKQFVERADQSRFDLHTQGNKGIHDAFSIPPIASGVGEGKSLMMTDANHTKVSMVTKIMPSPDWFIGIDSYDLCPNGRWLDFVHLELGPLDAGTDKGLTFTSPNWPSDPPEKIRPITAHFPSHPAGSFYYPEIEELAVLAQFTISKKKEYSLRDNFDAADLHTGSDLVPDGKKDIYAYEVEDNNIRFDEPKIKKIPDVDVAVRGNHVNFLPKERRRKYPYRRYPKMPPNAIASKFNKYQSRQKLKGRYRTTLRPNTFQVTEPGIIIEDRTSSMPNSITSLEDLRPIAPTPIKSIAAKSNRPRSRNFPARRGRKRIPSGDVMAVIDDIVKDYQKEHRRMNKRKRREERKRRREQMKKIKPPRDCRVSEWLEWSSCSKTCGIGEQTRTRTITKHARRGGKPCPVLQETTWCGSARACPKGYFNWQ